MVESGRTVHSAMAHLATRIEEGSREGGQDGGVEERMNKAETADQ